MSKHMISVKALTKYFGDSVAVDGISFTVAEGSVTGLLGGNGAGKTTTIAMLLGMLIPTSGSIRILDTDMIGHRYRALPFMNFASPYIDLPHRLSVAENLSVYAGLYLVPRPGQRIAELAEALDFAALLKR